MKQEVISNLSLNKDSLWGVCKYLYENPEKSYHEYKAANYIINYLKQNSFEVKDNYLNIHTAFFASYGNGYPKICFICEYDAIEEEGHITGHNLISEISLGAAISLKSVVDKVGGTIIVLGCPGEYLGGAKITMHKQDVFKDIDAVLMAHPDVVTSESGTSSAILPLSIKYNSTKGFSYMKEHKFNSLDAALLNFNIVNSLLKGFPKDVYINGILSEGGFTPLLTPNYSESKFYIRANNIEEANQAGEKLKLCASYVSDLMNLDYETCLYELPYEELRTNSTLSRLFCHNLKECGIINISPPRNINAGLSIGIVSKTVPVIHPYIAITENDTSCYGTTAFSKATLSDFAQDRAFKASQALAFTAIDLILQKDSLLTEVKAELFKA